MVWKITGYILLLTIIVLFITLNISHTSDISFIFFTAENVPVYVAVFISMLLGCLIMGIVWIITARKNRKQSEFSTKESGNSIDEKFEQKFGRQTQLISEESDSSAGSGRIKRSRKIKKKDRK